MTFIFKYFLKPKASFEISGAMSLTITFKKDQNSQNLLTRDFYEKNTNFSDLGATRHLKLNG